MRQDSFIEGELRKRWHPHIPMEQAGSDPHLMVQGSESSAETLAESMQIEIEKLKTKTDNHLKVPQIKTKSPYRKTTMFLIFLGLVFLGLVFFFAGFMTCFSLFPPQHVSAISADVTPAIQQGQSSYAMRNSYIAGASGTLQRDGVLTQIEKQTELASQRRAQEAVAQTTDAINSRITNTLGYRVESILEPITKGIAGLLINSIADPRATGMSYNARGIRYDSNQTMLPQDGAPIQSTPKAQVMPEVPNTMPPSVGGASNGAPVAVMGGVAGDASNAPQGTSQAGGAVGANNPSIPQNLTAETALHKAQEKANNMKEASGGYAGMYAVEMSTFEQSQDAYIQMTDMHKRGYNAYIVRVVVGSNLVYSLRFGDFKSYQDARDAVQGFRSLWGQPARVVITSPQDDRMSFK